MNEQRNTPWWAEISEAAERLMEPLVRLITLASQEGYGSLEEWGAGARRD